MDNKALDDTHVPGLESINPSAIPANLPLEFGEKNEKHSADIEVASVDPDEFTAIPPTKILIPDDNDEFIDPRLKNYPVPLVA